MPRAKMLNENKIKHILDELQIELRGLYGNYLKNIILYGSYARGESDSDSDIDIMILLDLNSIDQKKYRNFLAEKVAEISIKHDILISVIDNSYDDFDIRASYVPFYKNVMEEGISLYDNQ